MKRRVVTIKMTQADELWVDVAAFEQLLSRAGDLSYANDEVLLNILELYRGEFLAHLTLEECPIFMQWLQQERKQWKDRVVEVLAALGTQQIARGEYAKGQQTAKQLITLDSCYEAGHRQLMWLYAQQGKRGVALKQFETCQQNLLEKHSAEPTAETIALYAQIRDSEGGKAAELAEVKIALDNALVVCSETPLHMEENSKSSPATYEWYDAPATDIFHGRQIEQTQLAHWLVDEQCRVVALTGIGGVGKTLLAAKVARDLDAHFDFVLGYSLHNAPPLAELLRVWIQTLSDQSLSTWPNTLNVQLRLLYEQLQSKRCLLILDNIESILDTNAPAGRVHSKYEDYEQLIRRIGESDHRSTLLLTSREQPTIIARLRHSPAVQVLPLDGLTTADARKIFLKPAYLSAIPRSYHLD